VESLMLELRPGASAARTAMTRTGLSRPVAQALQDGLIMPGRTLLDYGCGRGGDVRRLRELGYSVSGWDPAHAADEPLQPADIVNLGYVVNVIEEPGERADALRRAWELALWGLVVAARLDWQAIGPAGIRLNDGVITTKGTFQKFYTQYELKTWIESSLGTTAHAAAPGIFYLFRDPRDAESFRARQVRQSSAPRLLRSKLLYEQHQELLAQLAAFISERGRLPDVSELDDGESMITTFGSIARAFQVLCKATGRHDWSAEAARARENLLVYIALSSFGGRPSMGQLPVDLQRDIKKLFGSYRTATAEADKLLFSLRSDDEISLATASLTAGKVLPDAVYFHATAVPALPPLLRVYLGCGGALAGNVQADVIKLYRQQRKVSYLFYPNFEQDPHPALQASLLVDLQTFKMRFNDFRNSANPPILHRKEALLDPEHPLYQKFSRLTVQEERADLLGVPGIGRRAAWNRLLREEGWRLAGHRLLKTRDQAE
jgi:DNA phosphorothioation-associated putative methyltransferase